MNSNSSVTKQTNKNIHRHIKIEFQNSIERLSFFCHIRDIKIAWINPWKGGVGLKKTESSLWEWEY